MDTSNSARLLMILLLFSGAMLIIIMNIRLLCKLVLKRKITRSHKIIWPALLLLLAFCIVDAIKIEPNWIQVTHTTLRTIEFQVLILPALIVIGAFNQE